MEILIAVLLFLVLAFDSLGSFFGRWVRNHNHRKQAKPVESLPAEQELSQ